jgi:hypothetical protein
MRALDTTARAAAVQAELHKALGVEGRVRMAMEMSDLAREFALAGVRTRHPGLSEAEVSAQLIRELYGATAKCR